MLRKLAVFVLAMVASTATAFADTFQVLYKDGRATYRVASAPITIFDAQQRTQFKGYTDRSGQILVTLPNGTYQAKLAYRNTNWCVTIPVTGDKALKDLVLVPCR